MHHIFELLSYFWIQHAVLNYEPSKAYILCYFFLL